MLTEFAFTPSIFDEETHEDKELWLRELQELGASMFPRFSASPILVADLYEGSWHPEVTKVVAAITDHRARGVCQSLVTKISDLLVFRPARRDWPEDELAWGPEAAESAA